MRDPPRYGDEAREHEVTGAPIPEIMRPKKKDPIIVRYAYLTPKGLMILEAIEKALSDVHLERIPRTHDVPLPSIEWQKKIYEKPVVGMET